MFSSLPRFWCNTFVLAGFCCLSCIFPVTAQTYYPWVAGSPTNVLSTVNAGRLNTSCPDPLHPNTSLVSYGFDLTAISMNLCWGGAIYEYWWSGHEFENHAATGALININTDQYSTPDQSQTFTNPTQAGDIRSCPVGWCKCEKAACEARPQGAL
jgi:hypothetical protein